MFALFASNGLGAEPPATPKIDIKSADSSVSLVFEAQKLYTDINTFVGIICDTINWVDKSAPQKEGAGFLNGLKNYSIDDGKTNFLMNENVVNISVARNGMRNEFTIFDSDTKSELSYKTATFSINYMIKMQMCFGLLAQPAQKVYSLLQQNQKAQLAESLKGQFIDLQGRADALRLEMDLYISEYLASKKQPNTLQ